MRDTTQSFLKKMTLNSLRLGLDWSPKGVKGIEMELLVGVRKTEFMNMMVLPAKGVHLLQLISRKSKHNTRPASKEGSKKV